MSFSRWPMKQPIRALFPALLAAMANAQPPPDSSLPEINVTGSGLRENDPADETGRPEWTSHRRFTTTRVYLQQAPWEVGVEQWWRVRDNRDAQNFAVFGIDLGKVTGESHDYAPVSARSR